MTRQARRHWSWRDTGRNRAARLLASALFASLAAPVVAAGAADVRLMTGPYVRQGAYAAVGVAGLGDGPHELRGAGVMPVRWEGAGTVVLPVLLHGPIGREVRVEVDGTLHSLEVDALDTNERLLLDATGALSAAELAGLGQALFPAHKVRVISTDVQGSPVAYDAADAVVLDDDPPADVRRQWLASGAALVVRRPPSEPGAWARIGPTEAWARRPVVAPCPGIVEPDVFAAVSSWRAGRTDGERQAVMLASALFVAMVALTLWVFRTSRGQLVALIIVSGVTVTAAGAWVWVRPDVAVRQADAGLVQAGREDVSDRWLFLQAPAARETVALRVGFVGMTKPVAFDAAHWKALSPLLLCDVDGGPRELRLNLPPASTAAVLQRTAGEPREHASFEPWANPLIRRWYGQRLGAFELLHTPRETVLRLPE